MFLLLTAVRVMLLTAIKEMKVGKGASINAIFTFLRTMYKYDPLKNRNHIKKTLTKMITEGLVQQVKGRGLAGSFKLGKNYKEKKTKPVTPVGIHYIFSICFHDGIVRYYGSTDQYVIYWNSVRRHFNFDFKHQEHVLLLNDQTTVF